MQTSPVRFGALYVVQVSQSGTAHTVTAGQLGEIAKKAVDGAHRQEEQGEIKIQYAPVQPEALLVKVGQTNPVTGAMGAIAQPIREGTGEENILAMVTTDKWDYQEPVITNDKLETGLKAHKAHFWRLA